MLDRGGAVAALGLGHLVGLPLRLHLKHRQVLALVGEQHAVAHHHIIPIGIHHDRQTEQLACSETMPRDNGVVILLVHEAPQRREAAHHQQLNVASVAIGTFQGFGGGSLDGLTLCLGNHQVHQGAAVGGDHPGSLG